MGMFFIVMAYILSKIFSEKLMNTKLTPDLVVNTTCAMRVQVPNTTKGNHVVLLHLFS